MKRPLNVAIAGYGTAGELHARLLAARPHVRVVAVADLTSARRASAAAAYPDAVVATQLDNLDTGIDLVVVATPPISHESDTYVALTQHRAHVLCEKPAVLNPERGRSLAAQAAAANLLLHPVHNYLYASAFRRMKRLIELGAIGRIENILIDITRTAAAMGNAAWIPEWRTDPAFGGGILHDHGPHAIYLACHLADGLASQVSCTTERGDQGAEQAAVVQLTFTDGTSARINLSWVGDHRSNRYQVGGSKGSLVLQGGSLYLNTAGHKRCWLAEDPASGGHSHADWTRALHMDLLTQIRARSPRPGAWNLAIHVADVVHAAGTSSDGGVRVVPLVADVPGVPGRSPAIHESRDGLGSYGWPLQPPPR